MVTELGVIQEEPPSPKVKKKDANVDALTNDEWASWLEETFSGGLK